MAENGYLWWRQRLTQMARYFHAFRIDHVLGFFRIWEIPTDFESGLMGMSYLSVISAENRLVPVLMVAGRKPALIIAC
jgi:4-alpha-glucanotransferase